ncbi:hypothetical protein D7V64_14620 [Acinetobacter cumulans]|uniref:Uncharacterized protein n=1 Tax=Acinetobacter cumulans TaxID=2136182 RepID=A0A3A8G7A7_9GAMM|nr:hypothetical protein [Acinetobacter cumulans]RKG48853.1 hypothetical protein D7V64_14620 [Acinetobacter cumulans]
MNQKTILALASIVALTIVIVSSFYFFSTKPNVQKPVQTTAAASDMPVSEVAASEGIPAAEVDGIDVEELTAGIKQPSSAQHEPKLLNFELDQSLKAADTLLSMLPYDELPQFEQDNIDKYQRYVFAKAAKDTGKSVKDFSLQEHGALESEQAGNRYYVYKFDNGTDCEIHLVSIDLNTGDYGVSYNYC